MRARDWTGIFPNPPYRTHPFTYTNGRLTAIGNQMLTSEGYTFSYKASTPLLSPFDSSGGHGDLIALDEVTIAGVNLKHRFYADTAGQLTKVVFPYGGHLRWQYGVWQYDGGRRQTEVTTRWASANGTAESAYAFGHDDVSDGTRTLHVNTKLDDPGLVGGRTWLFAQTGATAGLVNELRKRVHNQTTVVASDAFTWAQDDTGRWYIGRTDSTHGSKTARTDQTLDVYGNVLETKLYDWNSSTVKRVYTNTYLGGTQYLSRYIRNRLWTSKVTEGSVQVDLATNSYDGTALTDMTGEVRQRDTAYGTAFRYRGNLTGVSAPGDRHGIGDERAPQRKE